MDGKAGDQSEAIETLSTGHAEVDKEAAVMAERLRCANLIAGWTPESGKALHVSTRAELTRRILNPDWDKPPVAVTE